MSFNLFLWLCIHCQLEVSVAFFCLDLGSTSWQENFTKNNINSVWILNTVSHQKASNVRYCYPSTHSGHGIKVYKGTSLSLQPFALHCLSCPLGNTGVASEESPSVLRSRRQNAQAKQEDKKRHRHTVVRTHALQGQAISRFIGEWEKKNGSLI